MNVAIAIIQQNHKILITQRANNTHLPNLWEFPGGKQEPNETPEECLNRELQEELNISIKIIRPYKKIEYQYPDRAVTLYPYLCTLIDQSPASQQPMKWIAQDELLTTAFPKANQSLIQEIIDDRAF